MLCPRCEVGNACSPKRKAKKGKELPKSNKKKTPRFSTLGDLEKALSETKDSTSTVSVYRLEFSAEINTQRALGFRINELSYQEMMRPGFGFSRWQLWRSCG